MQLSRTQLITGALVCALPLASASYAVTIDLASTMEADGFISEDAATGSFARINLGDGSLGSAGANTGDADGLYNINNIDDADPGAPLGTANDLFPRETDFLVGSLETAAITGSGVETVAVQSLNLSEFWTSDPNRTNGGAGSPPTVVSDISDRAIGLWFFDGPGGIAFGALDANDTATFTDGQLTSIDLEVTTSFTVDSFGSLLSYDGTFSIVGNQLSYQINDTETTFVGPSTLVADLNGTVLSVVPEPGSLALLGLSGLAVLRRRRK